MMNMNDNDESCIRRSKGSCSRRSKVLHHQRFLSGPRDPMITDDDVKENLCPANVCLPAPTQGSTATKVNQLASCVRDWDRAVGLRLDNAVVLAAHRLCFMNETGFISTSGGFFSTPAGFKEIPLVCAMTGVPVPAGKSLQALAEKMNKGKKRKKGKGTPRLTVEEVAEFVPHFSKQTKNGALVEILVAGHTWDELRGEFVPGLSYANKAFSWNPELNLCTGSEAIVSQAYVDNFFSSQMSIVDAKNVALEAVYFAARSGQDVEGHKVESVDVCVITAKSIETRRHSVEELHAKYGPLVEERNRRAPLPRYDVPISREDEVEVDY